MLATGDSFRWAPANERHKGQIFERCPRSRSMRSRSYVLENPSTIALAHNQAEHSILSPLIRKLELLEPLSGEAKSRLRKLSARLVSFAPRENLLREAEPRGDVQILLDGVAVRFKNLEDRRAMRRK